MISFFRRIRQSLMRQNRFQRYFMYALGEILLVVLGILIALQIDNWNELRKDREVEQAVLLQLQEDFRSNLAQLNQKIQIRMAIIESSLYILDATDHPEVADRDSLIARFSILLVDPTFDPITFDLSSTGNLRLLSNNKLKRLLSNWTSDIVAVQEIEQNWSDIVNEQLQPELNQLVVTRDLGNYFANDLEADWQLEEASQRKKIPIGTAREPVSATQISESKVLEGLVSIAITYNNAANIQSETVRKRIEEILSLIESGMH
ncbi:DUF6090 family protein [Robiginitalea sp.]|uniref:DUF6090 family protein n=1 Tax=Robiginitalea sp. TaxID=1902411 RepID=UPI003C76958F